MSKQIEVIVTIDCRVYGPKVIVVHTTDEAWDTCAFHNAMDELSQKLSYEVAFQRVPT